MSDEVVSPFDALFADYHRTHDRSTRNRLVEAHLHVADGCARRYHDRGEPVDDLQQVARVALVHAVERFDPARGVSFEAYARPTIMGELRHHFRDNCWAVAVPRRAKDLRSPVSRATEQLSQKLGRPPTAEEIADVVGVDPELVRTTQQANRNFRAVSWESLTESGARSSHRHRPPVLGGGDGSIENGEPIDCLRSIGALDDRMKRIIVWRFYEECTQREIGDRLGIGQVQVSRLLARALAQLRVLLDVADDVNIGAPRTEAA